MVALKALGVKEAGKSTSALEGLELGTVIKAILRHKGGWLWFDYVTAKWQGEKIAFSLHIIVFRYSEMMAEVLKESQECAVEINALTIELDKARETLKRFKEELFTHRPELNQFIFLCEEKGDLTREIFKPPILIRSGGGIYNFLYALKMSPQPTKAEGNNFLGKLQITWHTNLGEPGRLQTQQIICNIDSGDIIDSNEEKAVMISGLQRMSRHLNPIEVQLNMTSARLGIQKITGISMFDTMEKKTYDMLPDLETDNLSGLRYVGLIPICWKIKAVMKVVIIASIEQYYDLCEMTIEEAIGRLKTYEERIMYNKGKQVDSQEKLMFTRQKSKGKYFRGCGRRKHRFSQIKTHEKYKEEKKDGESSHRNFNRNNFKKLSYDTSKLQCYQCKKIGHIAPNCPQKTKANEQSNLVEEDLEPTLLMAILEDSNERNQVKEVKEQKGLTT
ncbi:zinc finger, CCHC-type containing protein [Tanacetum coccineum]